MFQARRPARVAGALAVLVIGPVLAGCSGGPATGTARTPASTASRAAAPTASRAAAPTPAPVPGAAAVGPVTTLSRACRGGNAEVEQAADASRGYLYVAWIGCGGIRFARSANGGRSFSKPLSLATSGVTDGPALAVAPDGTLYVTYMVRSNGYWHPVVAASFNHGRTFPQVSSPMPPVRNNFGDRSFIAAGPHGAVYVTWDYAPSVATLLTAVGKAGSGYYLAGDLNAVIQKSSDHGKTWSPVTWVARGVPANGGYMGRLLVEPGGRIDLLYLGHHVSNNGSYRLGPGHIYFTSSVNGGRTWSAPVEIQPRSGQVALDSWWIDGAIGRDAAGNLYATWDTQSSGTDTGWLSFSADDGRTWSAARRVTPDSGRGMHLMAVAGGWPGVAYVSWLTDSSARGYAQYLRPFSVRDGWLSAPVRVSRQFGRASVWPGDTTGISVLPGSAPGASPDGGQRVVLSWGSATGRLQKPQSRIFSSVVSFRRGAA